jgi:hypothetical protein
MMEFIKTNFFWIAVLALNVLAMFTSNLVVDGEKVYSIFNLFNSFWVGVYIVILINKFNKMFLDGKR